MLVGFVLALISGSIVAGFVVAAVVFAVAVYLVWERREFGDEAGDLRGDDEEARVHARNAGAYSQSGHGGHVGAGGGFGG